MTPAGYLVITILLVFIIPLTFAMLDDHNRTQDIPYDDDWDWYDYHPFDYESEGDDGT